MTSLPSSHTPRVKAASLEKDSGIQMYLELPHPLKFTALGVSRGPPPFIHSSPTCLRCPRLALCSVGTTGSPRLPEGPVIKLRTFCWKQILSAQPSQFPRRSFCLIFLMDPGSPRCLGVPPHTSIHVAQEFLVQRCPRVSCVIHLFCRVLNSLAAPTPLLSRPLLPAPMPSLQAARQRTASPPARLRPPHRRTLLEARLSSPGVRRKT